MQTGYPKTRKMGLFILKTYYKLYKKSSIILDLRIMRRFFVYSLIGFQYYHRDPKNYTGDYDIFSNAKDVIDLIEKGKEAAKNGKA